MLSWLVRGPICLQTRGSLSIFCYSYYKLLMNAAGVCFWCVSPLCEVPPVPCILYDAPCAARLSDVFFQISDAVSKTTAGIFRPSNQFRIKGWRGAGKEKSCCWESENAARAPNTGAASSSSRSLKFTVLSSFTHQLLFDPHQPHPVKSVSLSFVDEEPPLVLHTVGLVSLPLLPSSN